MRCAARLARRAPIHVLTVLVLPALAWMAGCAAPPPVGMPKSAEVGRERGLKSNHASRRGRGSAAVLRGRVLLYHLWAEDDKAAWSDALRSDVRRRLRDAVGFLAGWAGRYEVDVAFADASAGRVRSPAPIPADAFAHPAWTERLVQAAGAENGNRLVARLKRDHRADAVVLVFHVNQACDSYNLTFYEGVGPAWAAERIVCFSRYADGRRTLAASYAHEILHAFGAGELYFPYDRADHRRRRAARLFPNDIMRRVDPDLGRLRIDAFTAYRIGWTDRLAPDLRAFEDGAGADARSSR
jgi:hypothetical protein